MDQKPLKLLNEVEAARVLGLSRQTLSNWRNMRRGPRYIKIGARAIRYSQADILSFVADQTIDPAGGRHA